MNLRLRWNMAANFAGRATSAIVAILFVPVYIRLLGLEAYGLVGFYANLQVVLNIFDFGLSAAMNREMARNAAAGTRAEAADFARTLEMAYWAIGLFVGGGLLLLSPAVANSWLRAEHLPPAAVQAAVSLMAIVFTLQWPLSLHIGGLMGLEQQGLANGLSIAASLLQAFGSVLVLKYVSCSIVTFFLWQAAVALAQTCGAWILFWRALAPPRSPTPRFSSLTPARGFIGGMSATAVTMLLLAQLDKVVLSHFLPLSQFAGYALASTVASAVMLPPAPVSDALFPRYVRLLTAGTPEEFSSLFHLGCQAISTLTFPLCAVAVFFPRQLIFAWTGQSALAHSISPVVVLLVLGATCNCGMAMMDALQMARGDMNVAFRARLTAIVILGPAMMYAAMRFGAIGCAAVWLVIYGSYVIVIPRIVLGRWLPSELSAWYVGDIALPLSVAFASTFLLSRTAGPVSRGGTIVMLGCTWIGTSVLSFLLAPRLRKACVAAALRARTA